MNKQKSIRRTTIKRFCIFALFIAIFYSATIILVAFVVEDQVIENLLDTEETYLNQQYEINSTLPTPNLKFVSYHLTLASLNKRLPTGIDVILPANEIFVPGPRHYHIRQIDGTGNIPTIYMLAEVGQLLTVSKLSINIIVLFSGVLVFGLFLAIWQAYKLASNTVKPITLLTRKVAGITKQSSSRLAQVAYQENEVEYLSAVIEGVFDNLEKTLARETRFTQDVSHELRTPLTIFNNTLELIEQREWRAGDLNTLRFATEKMQSTIDTLFLMARDEALTVDTINVRALLEDNLVNHYSSLETANIEYSIEIADDATLLANTSLFNLLVQNLLGNTIRHAPNQKLTITLNDTELSFSNTKTSTSHVNVSSEAQSYSGLGLLLVKRMAQQMSWEAQISNSPNKFEIVFLCNNK